MIASILRTASVLASLVLLTSFSLFAIDQAGGASQQAQAEITAAGAQPVGPALKGAGPERGTRATLDEVNNVLVRPVRGLAPGRPDSWAARSVELVGGLLLYGLVLGMLARSSELLGRAPHGQPGGPARLQS